MFIIFIYFHICGCLLAWLVLGLGLVNYNNPVSHLYDYIYSVNHKFDPGPQNQS